MPAAVAVPLITGALSTGASIYSQNKQAKAAKDAATLSPAGVQAQQGLLKQGGMLNQQAGKLSQTGDRLLGQGTNDLSRVSEYWRPQLSGDRGAISAALAPDIAGINDVYRGAGRSLDRSPVRGAQRDQQAGELRRQQAGQIALLPSQQRAKAAEAMSGLGSQFLGTGAGLLGQGAQTYGQAGQAFASVYGGERGAATSGQAQMLQQGQQNNQAFQTGAGNMFNSVLDYYAKRPAGSGGIIPSTHFGTGSLPGGVYHPAITPNRP